MYYNLFLVIRVHVINIIIIPDFLGNLQVQQMMRADERQLQRRIECNQSHSYHQVLRIKMQNILSFCTIYSSIINDYYWS